MGLFARSNEPCVDRMANRLSAGRIEKPYVDRKDNTMLILDTGIREELKSVEKNLAEYLRAEGNASQIGDILQDVSLSGGKRLRPQLLLLSARFGPDCEEKRERLCRLAALIEMVHAASLIHDDIVDDSPLRRGRPSIQSKYGKDRAVYAGDLLLSRIVKQLFKESFYQVGELFGRAVEEMCIGELGQMQCLFDAETTVEQYIKNIDGKTAALCRLACAAGAMVSGASEETAAQLVLFGECFGRMFQIRDDLLDFVSDASSEGKLVRTDFREGILTLPVLYAMEDEKARALIIRLMREAEKGSFGSEQEEQLVSAVGNSGGLARAYSDMQMYADRALAAVEALPELEVKTVLRGLLKKRCRIPGAQP